jgi:hypothetical protein
MPYLTIGITAAYVVLMPSVTWRQEGARDRAWMA